MQQSSLFTDSNKHINGIGTSYPSTDMMHCIMPSSPLQLENNPLDLLTSRSAPESNLFSPPVSTHLISGPFSLRNSPPSTRHTNTSSSTAHRSLPPETISANDSEDTCSGSSSHRDGQGNGSGNDDVDMEEEEEEGSAAYDGWGSAGAGHGRSLTDSTILAAQLELASSADFHEAMLKNDIDFAFNFSLDNLDTAQRETEADESSQGNRSGNGDTDQVRRHRQLRSNRP